MIGGWSRQGAQHFEVDVWPTCRAERSRGTDVARWHPGDGAGVPVGWHRVHAVCLESNSELPTCRSAHSRRMARGSLYLDRVRGRTDVDEARICSGRSDERGNFLSADGRLVLFGVSLDC